MLPRREKQSLAWQQSSPLEAYGAQTAVASFQAIDAFRLQQNAVLIQLASKVVWQVLPIRTENEVMGPLAQKLRKRASFDR